MSKIEQLIKEKCPNGVEYKQLEDIVKIVKEIQLNKEKLLEEGLYPVINGGITHQVIGTNIIIMKIILQ